MKPESKLMVRDLLILIPAFFFLVWGLTDILSLTGGTTDLLFIIVIIVFAVLFLIFGVIIVVGIILKRRHVLYKEDYKCKECGAAIKLEEENCTECGAKNTAKYEALEKLEDIERKIEKVKAQRAEERKSSKRLKTKQSKRLQEIDDDILANRERKMRVKQTKLIIGGSHDSKLEWIKRQSFDLNRTIQDIANDLGESMIAVRKYLDEIANRDVA